jgi:hemoglobin/transferrin/lactoferrin receptor protein
MVVIRRLHRLASCLLFLAPISGILASAPVAPEPATASERREHPEEPEQPAESGNAEVDASFVERVTVTATRTPVAVKDAPGSISVIGSDEIESLGMADTRDLLRYEPGVYVDGDPTRLGPSGFNVRGIGGNRVMTRIDGVETAEQFDFGPLSVAQFALDLDAVESVEIVRSAGSALYGSDALGGVVSFRTKDPADYLSTTDGDAAGFLRGGFDGRDRQASALAGLAFTRGRGRRWSRSAAATARSGTTRARSGPRTRRGRGRTRRSGAPRTCSPSGCTHAAGRTSSRSARSGSTRRSTRRRTARAARR